jgi:hypothetical protein
MAIDTLANVAMIIGFFRMRRKDIYINWTKKPTQGGAIITPIRPKLAQASWRKIEFITPALPALTSDG